MGSRSLHGPPRTDRAGGRVLRARQGGRPGCERPTRRRRVMRRSVRVQRRLDAPPEAVFEVLADHARYDRFDGIRRAELVRPGERDRNGHGAVRWVWLGPLRFEEEITAFEQPTVLDYRIREVRGLPFRHKGGSIRLTPVDGGTDVV